MIDINPATVTINGVLYELQPARIESTSLGFEHGCMTAVLHLDYGGSGQGAGQYILSRPDKEHDRQVGTAYGLDWIIQAIVTVGVQDWEQLPNKRVYALRTSSSAFVEGIYNIDGKGEPFMFRAHAEEWRRREALGPEETA